MRARVGDWFLTFTGKKFYPIDPLPEEVCIEDIAHGLAHICRFGGHCKTFYSVAQHSAIVSEIVPPELAFLALMHDATEAYVGDMVRPLKRSMPEFKAAELVVWKAIAHRFGLPQTDPSDVKAIKDADNTALMTERRDVCVESSHRWSLQDAYPPLERIIKPFDSDLAERLFLQRFQDLRRAPTSETVLTGKIATARSA